MTNTKGDPCLIKMFPFKSDGNGTIFCVNEKKMLWILAFIVDKGEMFNKMT